METHETSRRREIGRPRGLRSGAKEVARENAATKVTSGTVLAFVSRSLSLPPSNLLVTTSSLLTSLSSDRYQNYFNSRIPSSLYDTHDTHDLHELSFSIFSVICNHVPSPRQALAATHSSIVPL